MCLFTPEGSVLEDTEVDTAAGGDKNVPLISSLTSSPHLVLMSVTAVHVDDDEGLEAQEVLDEEIEVEEVNAPAVLVVDDEELVVDVVGHSLRLVGQLSPLSSSLPGSPTESEGGATGTLIRERPVEMRDWSDIVVRRRLSPGSSSSRSSCCGNNSSRSGSGSGSRSRSKVGAQSTSRSN